MEKQEVKSKWDELARQLGAEVSPAAEQLVETTSPAPEETLPTAVESSDVVSRLPAPKRRAAGWDNLANEFGLPTPPPPVEPVNETPSRVVRERVVEEEEVVEEEIVSPRPSREEKARREERPRRDVQQRRDERPRREERPRHEERPRREERPQREERPRRERSRDDRESSGRRRPPRHVERESEPIDRPAPVDVEEARLEETHVAQPPAAPEERASRGAAVSLWHKIFGSPVDQIAKLSDVSSADADTDEASRVTEDLSERRETELREHALMPDADQADRQEFDQREEISEGSEDEEISDRKRRRRRGRRRRGGREDRPAGKETGEHRRRRPDVAQSDRETDDSLDDSTTDDEFDTEIPPDDDMEENGDIDANGESAGVESRSRSALQRSIPSWDEAIGFIVESNMQTRSQRRPSPHSGARPHSPRGRGRGRRKN
jgi:hypothetical protein